jgi:hypothetical protein
VCGSLKGKLFHATKENTELKQKVVYLAARLEKIVLSEKMIEEDLNRVKETATKSTHKLGVGFERCGDKGGKSAPKFIPTSTYHQVEKTIKSIKAHYPSNPKHSFISKREVCKETPKLREEAFICMFCGRAGHLDEFCFQRKRIEKMCLDYARNSYHDQFIDFRLTLSLVLCLTLFLVLCLSCWENNNQDANPSPPPLPTLEQVLAMQEQMLQIMQQTMVNLHAQPQAPQPPRDRLEKI